MNGTRRSQTAPQHKSPEAPQVRFNFTCRTCGSVLEACSTQCKTPGRCPTCAAVFQIPEIDDRTGLARGPADGGPLPSDPTPLHAYAAAGDKAPVIVKDADGRAGIACPRCHQTSAVESDLCAICGFPFTIAGVRQGAASTNDGWAAASFAVGLVSFPLCLCTRVGAVVALVAAALGWATLNRIAATAHPRSGRRMALAGVVLAAAGLVVAVTRIVSGR